MRIETDRRGLLAAGGVVAALGAVPVAAAQAAGMAMSAAPAGPGPVPLPFDPASVGWLSAKLLTSHHDNNYAGAVKRLGTIRGELSKLDFAAAPTFTLNGLKREELIALNSAILHELYFGGFGPAAPPSAKLGAAIERDFGSMSRWAAEFSAMGKALGGGSGWVLLTWCPRDRRLVNTWAADHSMTMASGTPILALDMYEHAYHMDYGTQAAKYVDAVLANLDWETIDARYRAAIA